MNNKKRYLTKSRMKTALECPTKLYYYGKDKIYANNMKEDDFLMALAEGGYQVGELAKCYYPGGIDIIEGKYDIPLKKTNSLLKETDVTIFEAAIEFEDFFIRIDILNKVGNKVELIEVKSKSIDPNDPGFTNKSGYMVPGWRPYFYDVAFQTWVLKQAHPEWEIIPYLYLCDKSKTATVDGLNQHFKINNDNGQKSVIKPKNLTKEMLGEEVLVKISVKEYVQMIMNGFEVDPIKKTKEDHKDFVERVKEYAHYYKADKKYPVSLGLKCKNCEYKTNPDSKELKSGYVECWKSIYADFDENKPHIFDIWNYRKSPDLLKRNLFYLDELYADPQIFDSLNDRQKLQVQRTVEDDKREDISPDIFMEMDSWKFPLHFIDFETCMTAIPFHKGRHPYEQNAFQFSCHTLFEDGHIEHEEWIESEPGKFPNYDFVKALKKVLDKDDGTIFRYAPHENTVLRQIQEQMDSEPSDLCDELIEWIDTITEWKDTETNQKFYGERNMVDMWALLKKYYYNPLMGGSNSLKFVLPAIMTSSEKLKRIYSEPVGFGNNLSDMVLWKLDNTTNTPVDPYQLLPNHFSDLDLTKESMVMESGEIRDGAAAFSDFDLTQEEMVIEDGEIREGAAAMIAFSKMQFTEMKNEERILLVRALLQYCELDTLAMVMLYQHWNSLNLKFSRSQIKKAGKTLKNKNSNTSTEVKLAEDALTYWRVIHEKVINEFHEIVSKKAKEISEDAFVAQRLKRYSSIIGKLKRLPNIQLTTMQDIAGVRVVVKDLRELKLLVKELKNSILKHELKSEYDYLANPKESGYRGVHLIYNYSDLNNKKTNGLLVEIQIRTKLQHSWATAVETMSTFLGTNLKFDEGQPKWLNYFSLTSSAFSFFENTNQIPKYEKLTKFETFERAIYEYNYNKIEDRLTAYSLAADIICEDSDQNHKFHLVVLDIKKRIVEIKSFTEGEFELANEHYTENERMNAENPSNQIVLVSTESIHELRDAFPNYFLDTKDFLLNMRRVKKSFSQMKELKEHDKL